MPAVQLGALVALALTASAQERLASADEVAAASRPPAASLLGGLPPTGAVVMGALPTPPKKVVLQTKTYGTVTVDHAAHLARRTACRSCHGDGPVGKIAFTPRQAHDTCRACHVDLKAGPTDCRGCHVKPVEPPATVALAAPGPDGAKAGSAAAGPSPASAGAAAKAAAPATVAAPAGTVAARAAPSTASADLPPPPPPPPVSEWEDDPDADAPTFRQSIEAGMVVRGGADQPAIFGPSFELTSRTGRAVILHHVESAGGLRSGRTLLLVGGGAALPVRPRLALLVVGAGGLEGLGSEARLLPAAGLRVGLQWSRVMPHVELLSLNLTGITDLVRERDSRGERIGDLSFSLGVSAGFGFGRDR